jgi:hypothetical protein
MCARDQVMNVGKVGYGTFDRYYGIRRANLRIPTGRKG